MDAVEDLTLMVQNEYQVRPITVRVGFLLMGSMSAFMGPVVILSSAAGSVIHITRAAQKAFFRQKEAAKDSGRKAWVDVRNLVDYPVRSAAFFGGVVHPKLYILSELALSKLKVSTVDLAQLARAESDMFAMLSFFTRGS